MVYRPFTATDEVALTVGAPFIRYWKAYVAMKIKSMA
jgi:hypothetical protein